MFGSQFAEANGINDSGEAVGYYNGATSFEGFTYKNGTVTTISVPNSYGTELNGVNNAGQAVGFYFDSLGGGHSFLYSNGGFSPINVPSDPYATATAINNNGVIVGYRSGTNAFFGFYDDSGTFSDIFVPGSYGTEALGVNDLGQVVGLYFDVNGIHHPFLATPSPEPASAMLIAVAVCGFALRGRVRSLG